MHISKTEQIINGFSFVQVNVLSKVDLVEKYGKLHFNIDFYTDVLDLK